MLGDQPSISLASEIAVTDQSDGGAAMLLKRLGDGKPVETQSVTDRLRELRQREDKEREYAVVAFGRLCVLGLAGHDAATRLKRHRRSPQAATTILLTDALTPPLPAALVDRGKLHLLHRAGRRQAGAGCTISRASECL